MKIIKFLNQNKRLFFISLIFSFLFIFCFAAGTALEAYGTMWVKYPKVFVFFLFIITFVCSSVFLKNIPKITRFIKSIKPFLNLDNIFFRPNKRCFLYCFLFIVIVHFPVFMAYFPGIFTYDTLTQANFFINKDLIEIHPLVHNILIYAVLLFSQKFNTDIWGVFIYTTLQTSVVFAIFSYNIYIFNKYKVPFIIKLFTLLFFAFYPTNQVFPLIATKDVLFSHFVLLFALINIDFAFEKEKFLNSNIKCFSLILSIFLVFLFRHNGFLAYLIIFPFLIFYLNHLIKNHKKKIIILFMIPIVLYICFSYVKSLCGIKPAPIASSIGIPIQQIGRVRVLYDRSLSENEKKIYRSIIKPELEFNYFPLCVDSLKIDSDMLHSDYIEKSIRENPKRFVDLYLSWMHRYPKVYIDAFLSNNHGYWYILGDYKRLGLHYYLFTYNRWNEIYGIKIGSHSYNKPLRIIYDDIFLNNNFDKKLLPSLMYSITFNTWYIISALFILLYQKKYKYIFSVAIIYSLMLTVFFGPIVLLRYVYQNFLVIPLLMAFCFARFKCFSKID